MSEQGGFYSTSKLSAEMIIERYSKKYGFDFCILRFGTVYGERATIHTLKQYIEQAKNGAILEIQKGTKYVAI